MQRAASAVASSAEYPAADDGTTPGAGSTRDRSSFIFVGTYSSGPFVNPVFKKPSISAAALSPCAAASTRDAPVTEPPIKTPSDTAERPDALSASPNVSPPVPVAM